MSGGRFQGCGNEEAEWRINHVLHHHVKMVHVMHSNNVVRKQVMLHTAKMEHVMHSNNVVVHAHVINE
jgi:hypothetical protein